MSNEFHADYVVRSHEIDESREEGLAFVFAVEFAGLVLGKPEHFKIRNSELIFCFRNNFANVEVGIRLNHTVSPSN